MSVTMLLLRRTGDRFYPWAALAPRSEQNVRAGLSLARQAIVLTAGCGAQAGPRGRSRTTLA